MSGARNPHKPQICSGEINCMNIKLIFGSVIFVMLLLFAAGCTQPAKPVVTPVPTEIPTTLPLTTIPSPTAPQVSTPGPTQKLPDVWGVDVQVASNGEAINPQIIATFRGGKGMNVIPLIEIQVTRADGVVETERMTQPLFVGKEVSLKSTYKPDAAAEAWGLKDRAEVWATTPQGDRVKIFDAYIPFRTYN